MTLEARIIATKTVPSGGAIGYGGTWRCASATRIGVLACGYADGYPRHAPSGTPVSVGGRPSRVLGRISMDLMTVDLSECQDAGVGDWVELWGGNVAASTVAAHAGTIAYELVTRVDARVPRVYES
jgi:alanine racemase